MVCDRCIMAVKSALADLNIAYDAVKLGEVNTGSFTPSKTMIHNLENHLRSIGFEIIDDKKSRLIDQIKTLIIEQVHHTQQNQHVKLSYLLTEELHYDYNYLSSLFSSVEGVTIEQYFILQRIEKVKELLIYDELSLSEIAYKLNYSSPAYLSNQFKKITGLTPTQFKALRDKDLRRPIDKL
jgi:AraC-like DNA-binding protein